MVYCGYSLESPHEGDSNEYPQYTIYGVDSNENTQHNFMLNKKRKDIHIMPPVLALSLTLISSNHPCPEYLFMAPKVFEPLKVYCILLSFLIDGIILRKDFALPEP